MHYYQFNIGDYASHTAHLDPLEDIAYRRMLDYCYLNEIGLPETPEEIGRLIRMRTHCDCIANALREFFDQQPDGTWRHKRVEKELAAFRGKSEKASESARKRWEKQHANAMPTQCEGNANHKPITNNQEPRTKEGKSAPAGPPPPRKSGTATRAKITLETYLKSCKAAQEKPFHDYPAVDRYVSDVGIPQEFIALAWREFKFQHTEGARKDEKYRAWGAAFLNCLKQNWYRLWFKDADGYKLTTAGLQAQDVKLNQQRNGS